MVSSVEKGGWMGAILPNRPLREPVVRDGGGFWASLPICVYNSLRIVAVVAATPLRPKAPFQARRAAAD
jgi:hypothetical protein